MPSGGWHPSYQRFHTHKELTSLTLFFPSVAWTLSFRRFRQRLLFWLLKICFALTSNFEMQTSNERARKYIPAYEMDNKLNWKMWNKRKIHEVTCAQNYMYRLFFFLRPSIDVNIFPFLFKSHKTQLWIYLYILYICVYVAYIWEEKRKRWRIRVPIHRNIEIE